MFHCTSSATVFETNFSETASKISISELNRSVLNNRFVPTVKRIGNHSQRNKIWFYVFRFIIMIGSALSPFLVAVQRQSESSDTLYWLIQTVTLVVMIANGLLHLFQTDKMYYLFHDTFQRLQEEGWRWLTLNGPYGNEAGDAEDQDENMTAQLPKPTHDSMFQTFMNRFESIHSMAKAVEGQIRISVSKPPQSSHTAVSKDDDIDEKESIGATAPIRRTVSKVDVELGQNEGGGGGGDETK